MNGITSRCISFAQGNQDCHQRVNYAFGLVLGVDEFVDEQCYFLEKEYQHNRALHGYGTVSGLSVSVAANGEDLEVQVAPGMGIDQYGRVFIVRNTQCASLLSWLDEQELQPGEQAIFVIARYDECETGLAPIAGQPCSSSEQLIAASRLQDNFAIELALEPPAQPARQAVVNLAKFLSRLRVDPDAEDRSGLGAANALAPVIGPDFIIQDRAAFVAHVNDAVEDIMGAAGARIITVQPQIVEPLLDDIFNYWVTVVRPTLQADLIAPDTPQTAESEPFNAEILLARIDVTIPEEGVPALEGVVVDNTTRPYLLHTQLIQELFDVPEPAGEGGEAPAAQAVATFATVEDISARLLRLWIHLDQDLALEPNENVFLQRVGADGSLEQITIELSEEVARRNEAGRYYRMQTFVSLRNGDLLVLRFDTDQIEVGGGGQTLTDFIGEAPFTYANYNARQGRLLAFHVVERPDAIDEETIRRLIIELMPPQQPVVPFVTITPITREQNQVEAYELWFHLDGVAEQNDGSLRELSRENMVMLVESAPGAVDEVGFELNEVRPNVWMAFPSLGDQRETALVRFVFSLEIPMSITAFNPRSDSLEDFDTLGAYMERSGQRLEGQQARSERFGEALVVYAREQGFARRIRE